MSKEEFRTMASLGDGLESGSVGRGPGLLGLAQPDKPARAAHPIIR
jgi:hypothetical protein